MSIYKCFLFLLMACMTVNGKRDTALKRIVINAGDDYTFYCRFPNNFTEVYWYRTLYDNSQSYISRLSQTMNGVHILYDPNFSGPTVACQHFVSTLPGYDVFSLTVYNNTAGSAIYSCSATDFIRRYDTKVVGCPCIVNTEPLLDRGTAPSLSSNLKNVTCTLETNPRLNFPNGQTIIRQRSHGSKEIDGSIAGNKLTFSTNNALKKTLTITLNPFTNYEGNISCTVPALSTPAPTTQMTTTAMSTITTTPTEKPTSPPSTNYTSTRGEHLQNIPKDTEKQKSAYGMYGGVIIIVISAIVSALILILVIAIVVLIFRRKQERAPTEEVEETDMCYASIQDTTPTGHTEKIEYTEKEEFDGSTLSSDGMVDNHLYDFNMDGSRRELTTDPSTVDVGGPLYATPDKVGKSVSASFRNLHGDQEVMVHPSLSSRGRKDDVTPSQESEGGANHNNDALDGTEDDSIGDLYAVPDKAHGSRKGVAHYTLEKPKDNHGKGHDVSALYAVVDRSSKVAKEEPRDVSDLYAAVDKRNNNK